MSLSRKPSAPLFRQRVRTLAIAGALAAGTVVGGCGDDDGMNDSGVKPDAMTDASVMMDVPATSDAGGRDAAQGRDVGLGDVLPPMPPPVDAAAIDTGRFADAGRFADTGVRPPPTRDAGQPPRPDVGPRPPE